MTTYGKLGDSGKTDFFEFEVPDLGELVKSRVHMQEMGLFAAWFLDKVPQLHFFFFRFFSKCGIYGFSVVWGIFVFFFFLDHHHSIGYEQGILLFGWKVVRKEIAR